MKMTSKLIKTILLLITLSSITLSSHLWAEETKAPQSININTANAETIAKTLKGIGIKKAEAIVEYRQTFGEFAALEELVEVKGIGGAIVEKNRTLISLN